jgi:hypothetical protein
VEKREERKWQPRGILVEEEIKAAQLGGLFCCKPHQRFAVRHPFITTNLQVYQFALIHLFFDAGTWYIASVL